MGSHTRAQTPLNGLGAAKDAHGSGLPARGPDQVGLHEAREARGRGTRVQGTPAVGSRAPQYSGSPGEPAQAPSCPVRLDLHRGGGSGRATHPGSWVSGSPPRSGAAETGGLGPPGKGHRRPMVSAGSSRPGAVQGQGRDPACGRERTPAAVAHRAAAVEFGSGAQRSGAHGRDELRGEGCQGPLCARDKLSRPSVDKEERRGTRTVTPDPASAGCTRSCSGAGGAAWDPGEWAVACGAGS